MKTSKGAHDQLPEPDGRKPAKPAPDADVLSGDSPLNRGNVKPDKHSVAEKHPVHAEHEAARHGRAKDEFTRPARLRAPRDDSPSSDMEPPRHAARRRRKEEERGEQYIRLRVRVHDDRLSVVDSHLVDGPLAQVVGFAGTNAYEVTLGDRLLHAGPLPDLGVQRSFVDPEGSADQRVHHVTERPVVEFSARVPAHEVTPETIGDIDVRLHRVKGEVRTEAVDGQRLDAQFGRAMRPVAELHGLPDSALPDAIESRGGRTPSL